MSEKPVLIGLDFGTRDSTVIRLPGSQFIYTLKEGEIWVLTDRGDLIISHPDRPPKWVKPDGSEEEITI